MHSLVALQAGRSSHARLNTSKEGCSQSFLLCFVRSLSKCRDLNLSLLSLTFCRCPWKRNSRLRDDDVAHHRWTVWRLVATLIAVRRQMCRMCKQVCVQLPRNADNVALPAFARCTPALQQSLDKSISPARRVHNSKPTAATDGHRTVS